MKKQKARIWKSFLTLYTKFHIPWWLFLLSLASGLLQAEVALRIASYLIQINKGELYNSVIISYVLLNVLNAVLAMLQNILTAYGSQKITIRARLLVWRKILHLPMKEVERRQPSSLISTVVNEVTQASTTVTMLILCFSSVYGFFRACFILYQFNATLSLYLLLLLPLAIAVFVIVGKWQFKMYKKQYGALNEMTSFFAEHISSAKHIKAQGMQEQEVDEGICAINKQYKADIYAAIMGTMQTVLNAIYTKLCTVVIAVGGSSLIRNNQMESTGINTFDGYMQKVNQYLAEMLSQYQGIKGAQGALYNVNEVLQLKEEQDVGKAFQPEVTCKDIVFENVSFGYAAENKVLDAVSFRIPYGKTTALVGDNGSGKSTILKLMQGFYLPDSGSIYIGEQNNLLDTRLSEIRQQFGYVLQHNPLFGGTIRENIVYGLKREVTDEEVMQAAMRADAHQFIVSLPEGYETDIGESGNRLSGGQRQRIAIARVLMMNPEYLLLDEAGASLDHNSDTRIYQAVQEYMQGKTIVVIAHTMDEIRHADQIIVLKQGSIEAIGNHEDLLQCSETYQGYIQTQMKKGVKQ
ncbi:ABC transporter ATP-binding protein [Scatolibacter rhodanostii]|uniref:ABC transporter ATP-binding protein n=1 Tax=Scatolibacter rhodanostii TaxID=2014781 RepID=UPI000C07497E|nr:ABC transporter ATP-binding protein [Scatolibacter rhodanostii]